jgi:hypothetical protein
MVCEVVQKDVFWIASGFLVKNPLPKALKVNYYAVYGPLAGHKLHKIINFGAFGRFKTVWGCPKFSFWTAPQTIETSLTEHGKIHELPVFNVLPSA